VTQDGRTAILLAAGLLHASCSAQERVADPAPAGDNAIAAAPSDSSAPAAGTRPAMRQARILISSDRGQVTAELADNAAARALLRMLPLTIEMRDHLRQEKTGNLPSPLPETRRQTDFSAGTLGLWGSDDFVIYYQGGRVPRPGIIFLGHLIGDPAIFDRPGPITVRIDRAR